METKVLKYQYLSIIRYNCNCPLLLYDTSFGTAIGQVDKYKVNAALKSKRRHQDKINVKYMKIIYFSRDL